MSKERVHSLETVISIASTLVLIVILTLQVFARFVLHKSIAWTEEVSRIAFVWAVYGSIVYTAKLDKHIRLTFVLMLFPAKVQKIILSLADLFWIGMNLMITYQSILYIMRLFRFPYISQTLGINLVFAYFIVPVGFALKSYRILMCIINRFREGDMVLQDSRMDL